MIHLLLAIIYLSFISLGLPDALLGSAWPTMYAEFRVPVSYAGMISTIISIGTIISSLQSDRLTKRWGPGKITAFSVAMTAAGLFGFSLSGSFWMLCLCAIPYGLGAGGVDAALNNYVAIHYASRHMSWLHCMWGLGASCGPYIMGYVLTKGMPWNAGYRVVSLLQLILSAVLFLTLPLWKTIDKENQKNHAAKPLPMRKILRIPGAKEVMLMFFCYCALESTAGLWASSYLNLHKGLTPDSAASYAGLFYIGITAGRAVSGFLTIKFNDDQMIRLGAAIIAAGVATMLLPLGSETALTGLVLIGLGCAPIYPCVIHSTPAHFGADKSQAVIGVQMASAYVGTCLMPPLFGLIANNISVSLYPMYILAILFLMTWMHSRLLRITTK